MGPSGDPGERLGAIREQPYHGCGNHSCMIEPPEGMGTNGPCSCVDHQIVPHIDDYRRIVAGFLWRKSQVAALEARTAERERDAALAEAARQEGIAKWMKKGLDDALDENIRLSDERDGWKAAVRVLAALVRAEYPDDLSLVEIAETWGREAGVAPEDVEDGRAALRAGG